MPDVDDEIFGFQADAVIGWHFSMLCEGAECILHLKGCEPLRARLNWITIGLYVQGNAAEMTVWDSWG